jgi:hypothetical protein
MAAPNIVNTTSIVGITTAINLSTTNATSFLSNASSSNKVFKINTIAAAGISTATITLKYHLGAAGAGTSFPIASAISVPGGTTLVIVSKDSPIYLEENQSLTAQSSSANQITVVCSYESIS